MEVRQLTESKGGLLNSVIVYLISFYQEVISPIKGFSCAHCHEYGGLSCSEYVKQILQKRGLLSGLGDIRARFIACKQASISIRNRRLENEAGFLDCTPDGCPPDGCFDGAGGGNGSSIVIVLPIGILILLLIFGGSAWYKGPSVESIDIRLIEGQQEAQEKGVAGLLGGKQPDYQVIFYVNNREVATNVLKNSSAKTWLQLQPESGFSIEDIERFTIVNKQVLSVEVLEVLEDVNEQGKGEIYEYRIEEGMIVF